MKKALTAIIASALMSLAPQTVMAQTDSQMNPPINKTIKYEKCSIFDGFNNGYFGIGLLTERGRKCHDANYGSYASPSGSHKCTVSIQQDGKYVNKDCPKEVFDQLQ